MHPFQIALLERFGIQYVNVFLGKKYFNLFFRPKEFQRKSFSILKWIVEDERRNCFDNDDNEVRILGVQVFWSTCRKSFPLARKPNTFNIVISEKADQQGSHRLLLCNWNNKYLFETYLYYLSHYANTFATVFHLSTWSVWTHERTIAKGIFPFMWTLVFLLRIMCLGLTVSVSHFSLKKSCRFFLKHFVWFPLVC